MIRMKSMRPTKDLQYGGWEQFFYGSVTVGERGQIVIPAEARAEMEIYAGDKLLIMRHPVHKGLNIFKFEAVREFLDDFQKTLNKLEKESTESSD